ncbi:MAG: hypothetical protein V3T82_07125, partial [Nitrospinaceae bacterium]
MLADPPGEDRHARLPRAFDFMGFSANLHCAAARGQTDSDRDILTTQLHQARLILTGNRTTILE